MDRHLHIITHDIPWPADYGGVVDLFHKIRSLHALGVKVHLHCFHKGRPEEPELRKYCESVHYYKREMNHKGMSFRLPYIVRSRRSRELLQRLQLDNHPILMEGIHCTYLLHKGRLQGRKVLVRLHNVECRYYRQLARHESNIVKKAYYLLESVMLRRYEKSLAGKAEFLAVSTQDAETYRKLFRAVTVKFLPVFLPWDQVNAKTGKGYFCLYHGNLAVSENEKAADWLLNNVFDSLEVPFVIAGRNPSLPLQTLSHAHQHTCITANPADAELQDLINKAQVNILPSFNNTGIKLKLLNALYNGRHCLVNKEGVEGTGLEELCHIASSAEDFRKQTARLFEMNFSEAELENRKQVLSSMFNNEKNARQLIAWIY